MLGEINIKEARLTQNVRWGWLVLLANENLDGVGIKKAS